MQAAAFIRPSFEPSVFAKSLHIHRKSLFSSYTVLQMTPRALHVIVSEMGHYNFQHGSVRTTSNNERLGTKLSACQKHHHQLGAKDLPNRNSQTASLLGMSHPWLWQWIVSRGPTPRKPCNRSNHKATSFLDFKQPQGHSKPIKGGAHVCVAVSIVAAYTQCVGAPPLWEVQRYRVSNAVT